MMQMLEKVTQTKSVWDSWWDFEFCLKRKWERLPHRDV